jgi:hypothetical protein
MKKILIYSLMTLINFILSVFIYNYSFITQATPYLTEYQRMDSASLMLTTTLPAYLISAIALSISFYLISRTMNYEKNL